MSGNTRAVEEGQRTESFNEIGQTMQQAGQPIEILCTETPMLDQEPPTNYAFTLQDFWPFFKLLEILGLFPCKKKINEKGAIQLKPIRWWIPVIKMLGLSTLLILPYQILQEHLKSSNKEVSDYFIAMGSKIFLKNTTRAYVSGSVFPLLYVLGSGFFLAFLIKRKELCALQEFFSATPINNTAIKGTKKVRKAWIYLILIIALSLISIVSFLLYIYLPLQELLTTGETIVVVVAFLCVINYLYVSLFHLNTVILYLQLTCNIIHLIREIDLDSMTFGTILENTANLMKKVNMISSFLSLQCFYLILFHTIMIIVQVFTFVDYYSDGTSQFPPISYVPIGALILQSILILCIFNWQSYDVKQRFSEIRLYIFNFEITENNFVVIDKQKYAEEHSRKIVMSMLDEFKGFEANGYFILGKGLLGTIFIQCITFVVILIEFRMN